MPPSSTYSGSGSSGSPGSPDRKHRRKTAPATGANRPLEEAFERVRATEKLEEPVDAEAQMQTVVEDANEHNTAKADEEASLHEEPRKDKKKIKKRRRKRRGSKKIPPHQERNQDKRNQSQRHQVLQDRTQGMRPSLQTPRPLSQVETRMMRVCLMTPSNLRLSNKLKNIYATFWPPLTHTLPTRSSVGRQRYYKV